MGIRKLGMESDDWKVRYGKCGLGSEACKVAIPKCWMEGVYWKVRNGKFGLERYE